MPGLELGGPEPQHHPLDGSALLPCSCTALGTCTVLSPHHHSNPSLLCSVGTGNWGPWVCPYRQPTASRQEARQGPALLLDGQSFIHFGNTPWRWQLAVLPNAVPILLRKRKLILTDQGRGSQPFPGAGKRHSLMLRQILQAEKREACKECEHSKALCNVPNNPKHLKIHFSTYCQINLLAGSMFCCKADS